MKRTVNENEFINAFDEMLRGDNFSYTGRKVLFDILTEYEDACGEELELDVIAICCQFSEYAIDELAADYDFIKEAIAELNEPDGDDEKNAVETALDHAGAMYYWVDDETLILDVESF